MSWMRRWSIVLVWLCWPLSALLAQSEHGFINTRPSGQPYLTPQESLQRLKVPEGFEVKLFAAEPEIINPISFTVDERGRLWVVECYEYPKRTAPGKKPRDRIKILEDTTGAGQADKVTLWAEGKDLPRFDLASGIEVGHGGVFLGAAPYLLFLQDTKGAGHCDKHEILLRGFGSGDTHEVLNTLQWGPDGRLHGLQGIFTQSRIGEIQMNAALWRYDVGSRKFDLFAEGTSNPWGLDFDAHGQAFLTACVIPHAFHMIPGGTYIRQAGNSQNPYAYGLLREISDHLHHKESGWAHAGALVIQGDQFPPEYQGSLLMGSIHGCSIKRDLLERRGSSFVAHHGPDFLVSGDKNFRPINLRWGPDGSIYVIDWHDQNPCHQAAPDSWDMTHGRIYKIQRKGAKSTAPGDLAQKSSKELVELLKNNNPWWYRTALRLLHERRDRSVAPLLQEMVQKSRDDAHSLRALWGLYAVGAFDETVAKGTVEHESPWVRSWTVRLLGETGHVSEDMLKRLMCGVYYDEAPEVRLQIASTAGRLVLQDRVELLHGLMRHKQDVHDPCIPLMIWLAYEPCVAADPNAALTWLQHNAVGNPLVTDEIVPRAMRRLVATGKPADLGAAVAFLGQVRDSTVRQRALRGLLQGMETRYTDEPPKQWAPVFRVLARDPEREVQRLARRLAVKFHDLQAIGQTLAAARDKTKPVTERIEAVHDLADAHPAVALQPLKELLAQEPDSELGAEVCRTLAAYSDPDIPRSVLAGWKRYSPTVRVEAISLLAGRKDRAQELLAAVGRSEVPRTDLNNNTILRIRALRDRNLNAKITAVWGRVRDTTPAELNALIDRMRISLTEGRGSMERGRKVFENQCAKCHKFEGKGHEVGPDLDGAARDIEYLLVNVLDPNRVVGQPYYTRFVEMKNGRVETGLLHAEDKQSLTLKTENDVLKVLRKQDIEGVSVQEKSLMPEGLNKLMSEQDFRDLVRYVMANPFLTEVAVAGPFAIQDREKIRPQAQASGTALTWTRPVVGPPGRIGLPASRGEGESLAYVLAEVTTPEALRSRLQLGGSQPLEVWLNGKSVYKGKPSNGAAGPDQAGVEVPLRKGANVLLFEVQYRGAKETFFARLLDPQRKLQYPEFKK